MSRRGLTLAIAGALAAVLAVVGLAWPVPYVLLRPGPTFNTLGEFQSKPLIGVSGHAQYPTSGHLDLTTVSVLGCSDERVSLLDSLRSWLDRSDAVVPRDVICPPDQTPQETRRQNTQDMVESQDHARVAALRYLGIPVRIDIVVNSVIEQSPAAAAGLKAGDVLTSVDGDPVQSNEQLRTLIGRHAVGDKVQVSYRRGGTTGTVEVGTVAASQGEPRPIIGIAPEERPDLPFEVTIALKDVGGPSAGLMFALGIVDKLTPGELNDGKYVAGTGTIDDKGVVGPIGGIQQKIAAARARGATVFLTPAENCADAAAAKPKGLQLVRVATLKDAVTALESISRGQGVTECAVA